MKQICGIIAIFLIMGFVERHSVPVIRHTIIDSIPIGRGKTVLLDRYFNSEKRENAAGVKDYFHYTWEETSDPGFSELGKIFSGLGANLASLDVSPTLANLASASIFIIVDPDHLKDNPQPNFISTTDALVISKWVKAGGVLLLMANDSANCDLTHFNLLASKFGIRFSNKRTNLVQRDEFETGAVTVRPKHPIFGYRKMFLKDISVLQLKSPAKAIVSKNGDTIMAVAKFGKGTVFAVGDPWLYNEYIDGRRLPDSFNNLASASDLARWLLSNAPVR